MSCDPSLKFISALVTFEYATGVFSPARDANTSKPLICKTEVESEKFRTVVPVPTVTVSLDDLYPITDAVTV